MATNTPKLNLVKPDLSDNVDITELNGNMDILDDALTSLPAIDLSELDDVTITSAASGESLFYNGSGWINGFPYLIETTEKTADYTLVLADGGKVVNMNKTTAATLTVPANASVAFPIGTVIGVYNRSSNDVTVSGAGGVTVRNNGTVGQYAEASLRKRDTDEWVMVGG